MLTDIFNTPVRVNESNESGCLGATLLAMKSLGKLESLEEGVHQYVRFADTYHPDPSQAKVYQKVQREFVKAMVVR